MKKYLVYSTILALLTVSLRADQFWDPNGAIAGNSISGNWDTITANWSTAYDAGGNVVWVQGENANFDVGTSYTVTVSEPITNGNVTVTGTNGTLTIDRTAANGLTLVGDSIFNIGGSRTVNLSAPIAGNFALTKSGNGTLTLSGTNTYSTGTTLSGGTIGIGVDSVSSGGVITSGALGTGPLTFSTAATMLASGGSRVVHNPVVLNGGLTNNGSLALTFTNATFKINGATRNVIVNNTADLTIGSDLTDDLSARTMQKLGAGRLILAGNNSSYLGQITVAAGTLAPGTPTSLYTANTISVSAGATLNLNGFNANVWRLGGAGSVVLGTNTLTAGNDVNSSEFTGVISGAGGYVKVGAISQVLSGTNTFTGGITITAGSLYLPTNGVSGSPNALGAGTNTITITGTGRIGQNRGGTSISIVTNKIVLTSLTAGLDCASGGQFILSGQVSGSGGFVRTTQGSGFTILAGDNTFTGGVEIDARPLGLGHKRGLGTGPFTIGHPTTPPGNTIEIGSTLDLVGVDAITNATTINQNFTFNGALAGFGLELSGPVTLSSGTKTITATGTGLAKISGDIGGDGGIIKYGTAPLTLSGSNSYSGGTIVGVGLLLVNNTSGSGTGTGVVSVVSGASLGGTGIIAGPVTVDNASSIGAGSSAGKLTLNNGLDLSGINTWELSANKDNSNGTAGTDFDQIAVTGGNLVLGGSSILDLQFTNTATFPDATNSFWQANHSWKVIALSGSAANPGSSNFGGISGTNGVSSGTFSTSVDGSGSIVLSYVVAGSTPPPLIESNIVGAGTTNATLTWSSVNGINYQVWYNNDLNTTNWTLLGSVTASGSSASFTDTTSPVPGKRFYRIVVQ